MLRTLIFPLLLLMAVGADAASVDVADRKIEIPIPAGYCQFGKRFVDVDLARVLLTELGNDNQVLAFFGNCAELDGFRHRERAALDNFGLVFAQKHKGNRPLPLVGVSRQDFIRGLGGVAVPNLSDVVGYGESQYKLAQSKGKLSLLSQQPFHLQADENGAYFGIYGQLSDGHGEASTVLGVLAVTIVKEMVLSIEIYQRFNESPPIEELLARQQAATAKLVTANQLSPESQR